MTDSSCDRLCNSAHQERVDRVQLFGFSARQARFLTLVLVHSGVFLERQYRSFAGIAHGQKTHDFLHRLVARGYARAITPGALHRGRLFHLHHKAECFMASSAAHQCAHGSDETPAAPVAIKRFGLNRSRMLGYGD